jgi:hypothetical protein
MYAQPSRVLMQVTSPHQRVSGSAAVKSRPIRSGAATDRPAAADGGPLPRFRMASSQASGLHQPVDALMGHQVTEGRQAGAQPPDARVPPGLLVHEPHDGDESAVVFLPLGRLGAAPRVVTGSGHAEPGAHERHRIGVRISPARDGSKSH